jgi:hypothetical protein
MGICANVSLILYTRQARYYALAVFFTLLVTYLYAHWDGKRRTLVALSVSGIGLLASHYVAYAALGLCLAVDYLLFGRHRRAFHWRQLAVVALSQAFLGGAILSVWNPLSKPQTAYVPANWVLDKLTLWWWSFRDANACEFGATVLLIAAPILYFVTKRRNPWLLRLPIGIAVYAAAASLVSPEPVGWFGFADVRYIVALIPALILLGVVTLESLPIADGWRYVSAVVLFYTNVVHTGTALLIGVPTNTGVDTPRLLAGLPGSTSLAFVGELRNPLPSPYADASQWINANVAPEASVLVFPLYATYPLMFHAPHAVYAGQFLESQRPEYPTLPNVQFWGGVAPDYIVAFGPNARQAGVVMQVFERDGHPYVLETQLPVHWPDLTRPELFWRSFVPVPLGDPSLDGVHIYRRA